MEKVRNFLEKNVQWVVLGLSGIVFLLMVWMYVVQAPVKVAINGKEVTPGEIDALTAAGPVANYKQLVARSKAPEIPPVNFVDPFRKKIDPTEAAAPPLPAYAFKRTLPANEAQPSRHRARANATRAVPHAGS